MYHGIHEEREHAEYFEFAVSVDASVSTASMGPRQRCALPPEITECNGGAPDSEKTMGGAK